MTLLTRLPLTRALMAGAAAVALGLGAIGIAAAQQAPTPAPDAPATAPAPGDRANCPKGAGGGPSVAARFGTPARAAF
jgi:hypothetical protein